jgi:hypothetical protein
MVMTDERQVLCSACLQVHPASAIHVFPRYNGDVGRYIAIYHCTQCGMPPLEETRDRIRTTENLAEVESLARFFQRHGVYLHEFLRGDPIDVVRKLLDRMLVMVEAGDIKLSVGRTGDGPGTNGTGEE